MTNGDYFNLLSGQYYPYSDFRDDGIKCLKIDNISYGKIIWENITFLPNTYLTLFKDLVLNEGDMVIALNRPITNGRLKIGLLKESDTPALLYQRVGKFISKNDKADKKFIFLLFNGAYFKDSILKSLVGSDQPYIRNSQLLKTQIPLPPLPEQRRIATILSSVDAAIQETDTIIAQAEQLKQEMMQELFTGKKRLPGFFEEWSSKKMLDIGITYSGLTGKKKSDFLDGQYPYIPFLNVLKGPVIDTTMFDFVNIGSDESQNRVRKGDLLFNGSSETPEEVGMCSVLLEDVHDLYLNSFCFGFRLSDEVAASPLFLTYWFRSPYGRKALYPLAQGVTRYNIAKNSFMQLDIPYPSHDEQQAIAAILSTVDKKLEAERDHRARLETVKRGLMQDLLTGRVRVEVNGHE
ncbi:restriction endonuclease subunit S [Methanocrinis sp.]|uniref:restriction endonuclease subunit S n=1 Tax=Methanocrinis sp. TaxID=3101522 RepID=UPI003D0CB408